jgi:DNA-binding LytR/AlgR family response regulator
VNCADARRGRERQRATEPSCGSRLSTIRLTAYDEFAVKAFEVQALDYLLKPFDDISFAQVLSRVRTAQANQGNRLMHVLGRLHRFRGDDIQHLYNASNERLAIISEN